MQHLIVNLYIGITILSFLCSLVSFRLHYLFHLKLFSIVLAITAFTEIVANFGRELFHLSSNYPVYNIFMLVQYVLLAYYYKQIIVSTTTKKIINVFLILYPLFWIFIFTFVYSLFQWNTYGVMFGDLFIIIFSARYLYELFTSERLVSLGRHAEFWIAVALIFYSCCELPITGILNYLVHDWQNNQHTILKLFSILQILNIVMYSTFIYAFLCRVSLSRRK
jgi:hypothetical protein